MNFQRTPTQLTADRLAMLRLFRNVSNSQKVMVEEYPSMILVIQEVSLHTLTGWPLAVYARTVASAPPTVDRQGEYFRKEIVSYINRSMGFIREQKQYYAL